MMKKLNKIISKIAIVFAIFFVIFAVIGYTSASDEEKQEALNMREDQVPLELQKEATEAEEDEPTVSETVEETVESEVVKTTEAETEAVVAESETSWEESPASSGKSTPFKQTVEMWQDSDIPVNCPDNLYSILDEYPDCFPYKDNNYVYDPAVGEYLLNKPFFGDDYVIDYQDFRRNPDSYLGEAYLISEPCIIGQVFEYNDTEMTLCSCVGVNTGGYYQVLIDDMDWPFNVYDVINMMVLPIDSLYWPRANGESLNVMAAFLIESDLAGYYDNNTQNISWVSYDEEESWY